MLKSVKELDAESPSGEASKVSILCFDKGLRGESKAPKIEIFVSKNISYLSHWSRLEWGFLLQRGTNPHLLR